VIGNHWTYFLGQNFLEPPVNQGWKKPGFLKKKFGFFRFWGYWLLL